MVVRMEDFDKGVALYSSLLKHRESGKNPAMGLQMAFFDLPNGGFIEIVAPTHPTSVLRPALDKNGPGMNLMAFQCDDLKATVEMMKSNGVRVIEDDPTHIMVHPKSTHGILMQLVEKRPDATTATRAGQVPDTSGVTGIVSYKCTVVFVLDVDVAVASYQKLGLKLTFKIKNEKAGIWQAGFFLPGGGMIELIAPQDPSDPNNGFVKMIKKRGEGFQHLSLDGSAGAVEALNATGVKTIYEDPTHTWVHKDATGIGRPLIQLNPVGMGTKKQVNLGGGPAAKL